MGWQDKTDLALKVARNAGAFGEVVEYRPAADPAASYEIRGIFDDDHQAVVLEGDTVVSDTAPMLSVRLADLQDEPQERDQLVVRGERYAVVDIQQDGQGSADLILNWLEGDA